MHARLQRCRWRSPAPSCRLTEPKLQTGCWKQGCDVRAAELQGKQGLQNKLSFQNVCLFHAKDQHAVSFAGEALAGKPAWSAAASSSPGRRKPSPQNLVGSKTALLRSPARLDHSAQEKTAVNYREPSPERSRVRSPSAPRKVPRAAYCQCQHGAAQAPCKASPETQAPAPTPAGNTLRGQNILRKKKSVVESIRDILTPSRSGSTPQYP